jgi:hypothetical protein
MRRVTREARDRILVVDDAYRHTLPPETADDAETLVVATDDEGSHAVGSRPLAFIARA